MKKVKLSFLAQAANVYHNDKEKFSEYLEDRLHDELQKLPSGSGIDRGMTFNLERSAVDRLVFDIPFHHMDQNGFYCGWNKYRLTIRPSFTFGGMKTRIVCTSKGAEVDRWKTNNIKDYLEKLLCEHLEQA